MRHELQNKSQGGQPLTQFFKKILKKEKMIRDRTKSFSIPCKILQLTYKKYELILQKVINRRRVYKKPVYKN